MKKGPCRVATLKLLGNLSRLSDGSKLNLEEIEVPATLRTAMEKLRVKYGIELKRENILVLINGVEANALDDLETVLGDSDEIVFLPMFHGGKQGI